MLHLTGRHTYMTAPPIPRRHPTPGGAARIAAFHDHGILPDNTEEEVRQKTFGTDYRRRVRARLLELRDPLPERVDGLWLRCLGPWSPASRLLHTCHLCGACDTVSSAARTGAKWCTQCSEVAACSWPEQSAGPCRRTEEGVLHRRIKDAQHPCMATRGPRMPLSCGSRCTCRTPCPSRTCRPCSRPDPWPTQRLAEPTAPFLAEGRTGQGTSEPAAERRRRLSGAWWRMQ